MPVVKTGLYANYSKLKLMFELELQFVCVFVCIM